MEAKLLREKTLQTLLTALAVNDSQSSATDLQTELLALNRCLNYANSNEATRLAVTEFYRSKGVTMKEDNCHPLSEVECTWMFDAINPLTGKAGYIRLGGVPVFKNSL